MGRKGSDFLWKWVRIGARFHSEAIKILDLNQQEMDVIEAFDFGRDGIKDSVEI